ncbi:DUF1700 domain-containing protein [Mechercharimyces sp. CAU 1602]|uniref:DUF1700 domain-containing protein n=1 Tax=Mechercharimyces sp. CAU 1602 TaxID=2973933 RepID=UPI0021624F93|nr:DUF1700 domain-containing protein [Mechercharimyces sp. CAU 1602]MCS1350708.1 DUF1700 domain-containing protein [Mechercharimyces sp. CAU 1602]
MTKDQFMKELAVSLKEIEKEELHDILQDYEEHFAVGKEKGESEESMTASLGSPTQIAKEVLASYQVEKTEQEGTARSLLGTIWAVTGLVILNAVLVLGPILLIATIMLSGWVVSITLLCSPLIVLVEAAFKSQFFFWFDLFFSLACSGVGVFATMGMFYATKAAGKGFIRYLKFNISIAKGEFKYEQS